MSSFLSRIKAGMGLTGFADGSSSARNFSGVDVARLLSGSILEEAHTSSIILLFDGAGDDAHLERYPDLVSRLLDALEALEQVMLDLAHHRLTSQAGKRDCDDANESIRLAEEALDTFQAVGSENGKSKSERQLAAEETVVGPILMEAGSRESLRNRVKSWESLRYRLRREEKRVAELRSDSSTNPDILFSSESSYANLLSQVRSEERIISDQLHEMRRRRASVLAAPYLGCERLCIDTLCKLFDTKLRVHFGDSADCNVEVNNPATSRPASSTLKKGDCRKGAVEDSSSNHDAVSDACAISRNDLSSMLQNRGVLFPRPKEYEDYDVL